jgi:hypothetical protein
MRRADDYTELWLKAVDYRDWLIDQLKSYKLGECMSIAESTSGEVCFEEALKKFDDIFGED